MPHKNQETIRNIEMYITQYIDMNGTSPSIDEIARDNGIAKTTASRYLSYMREQGIINYSGHRSYSTKATRENRDGTTKVPVLGSVSCGIPKLAEENIEEYVRLPVALFGRGEFFLLRTKGDSMTEIGIDDGDLVLICKQETAEIGQVVVALVDDEATLKRYYPDPKRHRIRLHPENSAMDDIYVDHCIIQGVAVKVFKDII